MRTLPYINTRDNLLAIFLILDIAQASFRTFKSIDLGFEKLAICLKMFGVEIVEGVEQSGS